MGYKTLIYAAFAGLNAFVSCQSGEIPPPEPFGPVPSSSQLDWQKMEYYMFVHFGPNTFTDREWGDGTEDPAIFNPTDLDCRQWAATAKAAGMKAIILTAKHHDGFCLWPSQYSAHTVRESPWKNGQGDVLRELSAACAEYGLKFGVYLSPWDRNHPEYGTPGYNQVFANTLTEVLTGYGEVFEQWFDGANGEGPNGKKQVYDWELFHKTVYKHQPQAIIFSDVGPGCRWIGNEAGYAGETNWSRLNIAGFEPGANPPPLDTLNQGNRLGAAWAPGEADVSIRPGWFYSPSTDDKVKSLEQLLDIYYGSVGRNSNLLLNVPPDRRGRIHPNDSTRLMELHQAIHEIFSDNLARDSRIKSSSIRGGARRYAASNLLDEDYDTYWTTDDSVFQATIDIELDRPEYINRVLIQEYIPLGQRITSFNIEYWDAGQNDWAFLTEGTTIGYKRILKTPKVMTGKLRVNILESLACPVLNKIALYRAPEPIPAPRIIRDKEGTASIYNQADDASIFYTIDGTMPSKESQQYRESFSFPGKGTIRAVAIAEDGVFKSDIATADFDIAPSKWSVIFPLSPGIEQVIDGDRETGISIPLGVELIIDLGEQLSISGFSYTPFSSVSTSAISGYNFYTSTNGNNWELRMKDASFENMKNNPTRRDVYFDQKIKARRIRIEPVELTTLDNYSVAEIGVHTE